NSRPIDVHRWSDHPEIVGLVEQVWRDYFPTERTSGPKPKTSFRQQLRVLLLDVYVAWLEDPDLCIGVSMSTNYWDTSSRYNALHISKKIIPIIGVLVQSGLLDMAKGSYSGPFSRGNRTTRIRASEELQRRFAGLSSNRNDVGRVQGEEVIILRDANEGQLVEYDDTEETARMREELTRYNEVIQNAFIDVPTLEAPRMGDINVDHHHKLTRRIFNRGDWNFNGRFYGGWWQQINENARSQIFINDTPVVEVDFRGLHVTLLAIKAGAEIGGDPYDLPEGLLPGVPPALQRKFVKRLVLTAINADAKKVAYRGFRDGFPTDHAGKTITNEQLELLLAAFLEKSPHMEALLFDDHGIRLMNIDGRITERVHRHFCAQGTPVLSVHDSYIIDYTRVAELKRVMAEATLAVVGEALPTSNKFFGLDEPTGRTAQQVSDYVQWRQTPRTGEYLRRLAEHEARTGLEVVPYDRLTRKPNDRRL
ncbi:hypothetical protein, partial [Pseudosulfitobacter pseudonitzschiae]